MKLSTDQIVAMYESGLSIRKIAIEFGVTPKTIRKRLPKIDKTRKYDSIPKVQRVEWATKTERDGYIIELSESCNAPTIARMLGITKKTVYRIQARNGIKANHRPRYYDLSDETMVAISKLYGTIPTSEIAAKFNIDSDRVVRIAKRSGRDVSSSHDGLKLHHSKPENEIFRELLSAGGRQPLFRTPRL